MRYWWVNQNQTHRQEIGGGYLWAPKRKVDGRRNYFYDAMREVAPGDLVFSFVETRIAAIGISTSYCYEFPKPTEFEQVSANWHKSGWRVDVRFQRLFGETIRPKDHIAVIRPLLPERYAPLNSRGDGNQGLYLTELPRALALLLAQLIGREVLELAGGMYQKDEASPSADGAREKQDEWERKIEEELQSNTMIPETERKALIQARIGQGIFRGNLFEIERFCRITRVDRPEHLIASHVKPWRDSSNDERLDPENGLLLTPSIDHLFDRGFIGFEGNGSLLISPIAHKDSLRRMGVPVDEKFDAGTFTAGQRKFLEWHREYVLLDSHAACP